MKHLDASGLLCPMPVIRTQDAIRTLHAGDELTVTATDPGTMHDIPAWCRVHGHTVVRVDEESQRFTFLIQVA
ncbi:MAG: sulfurtransferase TusA family protein [Pseudomonadota bacterium]